jgi:hypothetical protein
MPRGPARPWRALKQPVLDSHIAASINAKDMHPETGYYGELVYTGCKSEQRASEIKQALFRAAKRQGVSITAKVEKSGSEWQVRFTVINKAHARRFVVSKYGTDRNAWPYNPRRRDAA